MPPDTSGAVAPGRSSELYGPDYYASHCGPVPYSRNDHWLSFFGRVADELVRAFAPRRVFDAGCALGLLVECLWDRGVEAHGRDLSGWAISEVRADVRPFCAQGAIADPIIGDGEGEYDLLTCIEVVEHMPEADALRAVKAMAAAAPRILFSSSPTDLDEPTHCTVRPPATGSRAGRRRASRRWPPTTRATSRRTPTCWSGPKRGGRRATSPSSRTACASASPWPRLAPGCTG